VVHCAHAAGARKWKDFRRVNVDVTLSLYEAAAQAKCKHFIFISSVAVYGVHRKRGTVVTEESKTSLGKSRYDFYVRSKTMAETMLLERAAQGGPKLLIIRPGVLYSPNGMRLARRSIPTNKGLLLITFGRGRNHIPFTRVDVLSRAIAGIVNSGAMPEGIYNMTGNSEETINEFIAARLKAFNIDCRFFKLPILPFRLVAFFLEGMYKILFIGSPPKITRYLLDSGARDMFYDNMKAKTDLGWSEEEAVKPLEL